MELVKIKINARVPGFGTFIGLSGTKIAMLFVPDLLVGDEITLPRDVAEVLIKKGRAEMLND